MFYSVALTVLATVVRCLWLLFISAFFWQEVWWQLILVTTDYIFIDLHLPKNFELPNLMDWARCWQMTQNPLDSFWILNIPWHLGLSIIVRVVLVWICYKQKYCSMYTLKKREIWSTVGTLFFIIFLYSFCLHYDEGLALYKYSLGFLIGELGEGVDFALKWNGTNLKPLLAGCLQ